MDNMPPLPTPNVPLVRGGCFTADQMHAYARAYAEQRCAPLVEALSITALYRGAMTLADGSHIRVALAAEQEHSHG